MRKTLLFLSILLYTIQGLGQIAGPNNGATFTNVAIAGSNKSWTNMSNVATSDNVYATYGSLTGSSPSYTDYLQVTNFGFAIPSGVTITGILVVVERSDPNQRTADYSVRIVKGGVIGSAERSSGSAYLPVDASQTYGNSGDLWGDTWTDADINSSNFGVAVSAIRTVSGSNAGRIDNIQIVVYYNFITLPVKLSGFTAKKDGAAVDLMWTTSEESNMNRYEVERSLDGNTFITVQNIASRNQAITYLYTTTDIHPGKGINYYRLKMTDNNGRVTYSRVVAIQFSNGKNLLLYPNIFKGGSELNITNLNGDEIRVDFYGMGGQLLGKVISTGRTISTSSLVNTKGIVIYQLKSKDGFVTGSGTLQVY